MKLTRIQIVLVAASALFVVATVYALAMPQPVLAIPQREAPAVLARPHTIQPFAPPAPTAFAVINERSLFDPKRQPVKPRAISGPGNGEEAAAPPQFQLVGVILDAQKRLAMVKSARSPLAIAIAVGENIDGWEVKAIEADRVILRSGSGETTVMLKPSTAQPGMESNPGVQQQSPPQNVIITP